MKWFSRKGRTPPRPQRCDEPAREIEDLPKEAQSVMTLDRWEAREEPFRGFGSQPGKFQAETVTLFINALACKLWERRLQQSRRQVGGRKIAVACCSRCGWQTVRSAYAAEEEAHLVPEPTCESGQVFVGQALIMAPIAIPVALGLALLILTG